MNNKMKCCVPACKSSTNSGIITLHKFPKPKIRRDAWFAALGLEENDLDGLMVCSLHFKDSSFYKGKHGLKLVQRGAVPTLQVCMICLETDCHLYPLSKYHLEQAYESLTGLNLKNSVGYMEPSVCSQCAWRLNTCNEFRHKSLRAHMLLMELSKKHDVLTVPRIKTINRFNYGLTSSLTPKIFKPNHSDLDITEETPPEMVLEYVEPKSTVKVEPDNETVIEQKEYDSLTELKNDEDMTDLNELQENDCIAELQAPSMKNDLNNDIDIDVNFLNNENDDDFIYDNEDDDSDFLNDNFTSAIEKKESDINLEDSNIEVEVKFNHFEEIEKDDVNKKLPKDDKEKKTTKVKSAVTEAVDENKTRSKRNVKKNLDRLKSRRTAKAKVKAESEKNGKTNKKSRNSREKLTIFDEIKLSLEEQLEDINKRKLSSNYKNSSYKCEICFKGFISETTYARHMEKHSKSFGNFQCPICKQYVKDKYVLQKHTTQAHSTRYKCTLCDFTTMTSASAWMHQDWHKGTKYKCEHCDAEFLKYTSCITHMRVKHPSDHICAQCGYSYLNASGLNSHVQRIHRHTLENPSGPLCAPCGVRFASVQAYEQHLKVSPKHNTPETRQSNQAVPRRSYKRGAWRERRPGEPEDCVTCEQCGVQLSDYHQYSFHFKRVHPDKNRTQFAPSARAVLCELCGRSFQTPHHLKYHMAKHTGQKDFQCDVCEKRFRIKVFLDKHKETHLEMGARRMHKCAVCDKGFTCTSSLNRHMWIHKGKSFKCEICEKAFSNASERNCHVSHVHMKVPWPKRQRGPAARARPAPPPPHYE